MNIEIEVKFKDTILKGILLKEDDVFLTLKLSSGYNVNLKKENLTILKKSEIKIDKKDKLDVVSKKSNLKNKLKVALFHTGGTIASKVDYKTGAVSSKFTPDELLNLFGELEEKVSFIPVMIGNLMSEDFRFAHYNLLLENIAEQIKNGVDAIIITHGTDTMHYSAAALQYASYNLSVPIILVGAQRSSDRPSSDAFSNLRGAVDFLVENDKWDEKYLRIGICMHKSINDDEKFVILDGINSRKLHSSRRDAFEQVNYLPFAEVVKSKVNILRRDLLSKKSEESFKYVKFDEKLKIGFFKSHPNLFTEEIKTLRVYDGVVFEGTGLGHFGINCFDNATKVNKKNFEEIKSLAEKTKIVVGVQTVHGETNLNVYSSGRKLLEAGIFGNHLNLISETLFARLAFCLSQKEKSFEECWGENLEGFEIRSVDIEK